MPLPETIPLGAVKVCACVFLLSKQRGNLKAIDLVILVLYGYGCALYLSSKYIIINDNVMQSNKS